MGYGTHGHMAPRPQSIFHGCNSFAFRVSFHVLFLSLQYTPSSFVNLMASSSLLPELPPEVFAIIGQYLRCSGLVSCIRISKEWKSILVQVLWYELTNLTIHCQMIPRDSPLRCCASTVTIFAICLPLLTGPCPLLPQIPLCALNYVRLTSGTYEIPDFCLTTFYDF